MLSFEYEFWTPIWYGGDVQNISVIKLLIQIVTIFSMYLYSMEKH